MVSCSSRLLVAVAVFLGSAGLSITAGLPALGARAQQHPRATLSVEAAAPLPGSESRFENRLLLVTDGGPVPARLDLSLSYDPRILVSTAIVPTGAWTTVTADSSAPGLLRLAFAARTACVESCPVAMLRWSALREGVSPLQLLAVHGLDEASAPIAISRSSGTLTVGEPVQAGQPAQDASLDLSNAVLAAVVLVLLSAGLAAPLVWLLGHRRRRQSVSVPPSELLESLTEAMADYFDRLEAEGAVTRESGGVQVAGQNRSPEAPE